MQLFTDEPASDPIFVNVRAARNDHTRLARQYCETLWEQYQPHADPEFLIEVRKDFHARYWEMYLTTALMEQGYVVRCPKPGPDVGIVADGRRIWFEATSPTRGADGTADQVPELPDEGGFFVPNDKLVLRYLNSISDKRRQYGSWLQKGIVAPDDAYVVALNPRKLGFEHADTDPPRILQAAFAVGSLYAAIDRETLKVVRTGYQFRDAIAKERGAMVACGLFHRPEHANLSGLLCSRVDPVNRPELMGHDFQLVPNPEATVLLPSSFRLRGTYFRIECAERNYRAVRETCVAGS